MDAVSVYPALGIVALTLLTLWFISAFHKNSPAVVVKYPTIEGLRGYLALFVFICHSCASYYYLHTGEWGELPSNLYNQLGYASVALFFMITGFLFSSKLIDGRKQNIDWTRLVVSRILRLTPLYLAVFCVLLMIVFILSDYTAREPYLRIIKKTIHWVAFTVIEKPDINQVKDLSLIMAGVTWTFVYEWLFYLSLPFLGAVFYRTNFSSYLLVLTVSLFLFITFKTQLSVVCFYPFAGGIVASFLVRSPTFCRYSIKKINALLIICCLTFLVLFFNDSFNWKPLLLLSVVFILIACGNDLFGALTTKVSYTLGKMAYSIYLVHGLILFTTFHFIIGKDNASSLSVIQHWSIIGILTPPLLIICHFTYLFIERPGINATPRVTAFLKRRLNINSDS